MPNTIGRTREKVAIALGIPNEEKGSFADNAIVCPQTFYEALVRLSRQESPSRNLAAFLLLKLARTALGNI